MKHMRLISDQQHSQQDDSQSKLIELELMMKKYGFRERQQTHLASESGSSRPASVVSSRGISPSSLEHKTLLKLETQICASMRCYKGIVHRAQQLSAVNKNYVAHPHTTAAAHVLLMNLHIVLGTYHRQARTARTTALTYKFALQPHSMHNDTQRVPSMSSGSGLQRF